MGKDQELLDAARNGSLSVVEKILSQRAKRSGPLASLRRGPGANVQDNSGYTPLHHSALNGHKDIVMLLLAHDASPNTMDHKGSSPLHLAAWTGNTEIVKLLLVQSNVQPNVNLTNRDGDTPLHCAAQYGHVDVVSLLLQHNCDPTIRNLKEEISLDLAAQYGRLETVEILVKTHPELLSTGHTRKHSALHLASRNGHRQVVQVLLTSGFPVNALTDSGSALHEAATFGKLDVVRVLLDSGIDLDAEDHWHRTVMDILEDLKSHKSQEIATVIQNHGTLITTADYDLRNANPPSPQFVSHPYENVVLPKWASVDGSTCTPIPVTTPSPTPIYQIPPKTPRSVSVDLDRRSYGIDPSQMVPRTPETLESSFEGSDLSGTSVYQTPPPPREIDTMSIGSSYYETPPTPREVVIVSGKNQLQRTSMPEGDPTLLYQVPPPPREVLKRMSDPSNTLSSLGCVTFRASSATDANGDIKQLNSAYMPMMPSSSRYLRPPQKPPRKSMSPHSPTKYEVQAGPPGMTYEYLCLASTGSHCDSEDVGGDSEPCNNGSASIRLQESYSAGDYVDMKVRHSFVLSADNEFFKEWKKRSKGFANVNDEENCVPSYENVVRSSCCRTGGGGSAIHMNSRSRPVTSDCDRLRKPNVLDFANKRRSLEGDQKSPVIDTRDGHHYQAGPGLSDSQPLSPTGYEQPPTPDFPPPSPGTAELGIHEKMRPLSQEYKRRSRDNETLTEDEVFQLIQDQHGITLQVVTKENKSVSTENIEEITGDAPFAGLQRGSKAQSCSSDDSCTDAYPKNRCNHQRSSSEPHWVVVPVNERRSNNRQSNAVYENVKSDMDPLSKQRYFTISSNSNSGPYENLETVISPFDENAEWAKINDIMASFGGSILRPMNSPLYREMEDELINRFQIGIGGVRLHMSPVGKWLSSMNVGEYESHFLANGFDDLQFMGGQMLEEKDLVEMGIANSEHRKVILEATLSLPTVKTIRKVGDKGGGGGKCQVPETVEEWLSSLHLDAYIDTFHRHKYDDMERILKMWEVELTTVLEITLPGHKKRILASLGERPVAPRLYNDVNELNFELSNLKHEINQLDQMGKAKVSESNQNGTLRRRNGSHKPPAPPPPPLRQSSSKSSSCDSNGNKEGGGGGGIVPASPNYQNGIEGITIRDPSQLFSGIPTSLTTQWRHKPEDFIVGSCNYSAKYLGSTLVKELKGVESTKKSIQKLKKSTNEIAKVPNVILSISYKGVKFIDASTKYEVCEHEIRNINCACQDADDLDHFAYITKDHQTGNHYCHVFSVITMDMATEIILTLGQAFEVAYQVALRERSLQSAINQQGGKPPPLLSPKAQDETSLNTKPVPATVEKQ